MQLSVDRECVSQSSSSCFVQDKQPMLNEDSSGTWLIIPTSPSMILDAAIPDAEASANDTANNQKPK